jgi:hypothetical protein
MSLCVYSVLVLLYVCSGLATGLIPGHRGPTSCSDKNRPGNLFRRGRRNIFLNILNMVFSLLNEIQVQLIPVLVLPTTV